MWIGVKISTSLSCRSSSWQSALYFYETGDDFRAAGRHLSRLRLRPSVIAISWTYSGLNPEEFEGRVTLPYEKVLTTLVDNIQHIESTTYNGVECRQGLLKSRDGERHR